MRVKGEPPPTFRALQPRALGGPEIALEPGKDGRLALFEWLRSPVEGIFHCRVAVAQEVRTGDVVGDLTDLVGEPLATVTAPTDGVVLFSVTSPAIKKDGLLLGIGAL